MQLTPISYNSLQDKNSLAPNFRHGGESFWKSEYSKKEKAIVAGTTALGVFSSLALLAKTQGRSIKPKPFFNYLKTTPIKFKEVISMGLGTCIGGLVGGYIIDKNPQNRKAKQREAIMQIGNISIPIGTVAFADLLCNKSNVSKKSIKGKSIRTASSIGAIAVGIYLANFAMNKLSNQIFKNGTEGRGVKGTDLFPHIDDVLASGEYIVPNNKYIRLTSRIVPFALMVAGNEVGNKKAN